MISSNPNQAIMESVNKKWDKFALEYKDSSLSEDELLEIYFTRLTIPELVWVSKMGRQNKAV